MSMSPVGDAFRRRCRMFPSLVNCTTIDWFTSWPTEALYSVALGLLTKIAPTMKERIALASTTVFMHKVSDQRPRDIHSTPLLLFDPTADRRRCIGAFLQRNEAALLHHSQQLPRTAQALPKSAQTEDAGDNSKAQAHCQRSQQTTRDQFNGMY